MYSVLQEYQFGFIPGQSTIPAIITLVDKFSKSIDSRNLVIKSVSCLEKAFDVVV